MSRTKYTIYFDESEMWKLERLKEKLQVQQITKVVRHCINKVYLENADNA